MSEEDIEIFVDDFIGHHGGYLQPWEYHDEILKILRRAEIFAHHWESAKTGGARKTMKQLLRSQPPDAQARIVAVFAEILLSGKVSNWVHAPPHAVRRVEQVVANLSGLPVIEVPDLGGTWPDVLAKLTLVRKEVDADNPTRALTQVHEAVLGHITYLARQHKPPIATTTI